MPVDGREEHLVAVEEWLAGLERHHGPVPAEAMEWAADVVTAWEATRRS